MFSYKIYLSKSHEVISVLAKGFEVSKDNVISISHGAIFDDEKTIPDIYKNIGYFHCTIKYKAFDNKQPFYTIVFA